MWKDFLPCPERTQRLEMFIFIIAQRLKITKFQLWTQRSIGSRSENHHFLVLQTGSMKPTKNSLSGVILGTQHNSDVKSTSKINQSLIQHWRWSSMSILNQTDFGVRFHICSSFLHAISSSRNQFCQIFSFWSLHGRSSQMKKTLLKQTDD